MEKHDISLFPLDYIFFPYLASIEKYVQFPVPLIHEKKHEKNSISCTKIKHTHDSREYLHTSLGFYAEL